MTHVTRTTVLPAEPARVWEAVGSPERLSRWLGVEVELDLRPGGEGMARERDGSVRRLVVEEVEPGERLAFHWWRDDRGSTVEIDLKPAGDGTALRVTETMLPVASAVPPVAMALARP